MAVKVGPLDGREEESSWANDVMADRRIVGSSADWPRPAQQRYVTATNGLVTQELLQSSWSCTVDKQCTGREYVQPGTKDIYVQLVISLALGVSAFLAFCVSCLFQTLRPRWHTLYAARTRRLGPSRHVPTLPDTFLGWLPVLYRITEQQVLASAGLDAFVFLAFFKMAIRVFAIMFLFALVMLEPINRYLKPAEEKHTKDDDDTSLEKEMGYLWAYLVFTYFFTWLTVYYLNRETYRVIRIRQDYLGTQQTITDRTFRLSGIRPSLRTQEKIRYLVENLEIGKVDSVTVCRDWKQLDEAVAERDAVLRKLEETWSVYLGQMPLQPAGVHHRAGLGPNGSRSHGASSPDEEIAEEDDRLLGGSMLAVAERRRPQTRLWYGFLRMQSRKTDGIDYYQEKLRRLDDKIRALRRREFEAADLAFVTMDSTAACQMAIQALIDPHPGQMLTKSAPAPSDIVWTNTYATPLSRHARTWIVTIFVIVLSVVWLVPVASVASILSLCTIRNIFPAFAESLQRHDILKTLVQTGLPTAVVSLLNLGVPYLYEYLSYQQGMLSRGDIELSVISKNFFFTFFNIFLVFTVVGTGTEIFNVIRDSLKDTTYIARVLAGKLVNLSVFYINFILLQGLGLFPFRLLEFGSVCLYPIYRMGAKTRRDYAEMAKPPVFSYGFYLPTALLVFILCLVYSVLPGGYIILLVGLVYFSLGSLTYKYQLLYAMDQPQHATGGAWRMIGYRIILGLVVLQLTMSGFLALRKAFTVALLVVPLLLATLWYCYIFRRRFVPLTRFISLRSIKRGEDAEVEAGADVILDHDFAGTGRQQCDLLRRNSTLDEDKEKGLRFVNPSLVMSLQQPWIYHDPPPPLSPSLQDSFEDSTSADESNAAVPAASMSFDGRHRHQRPVWPTAGQPREDSAASNVSTLSLGDTHIWREA